MDQHDDDVIDMRSWADTARQERPRVAKISGLLQNALIADLVMADHPDAREYLIERQTSEHEWTGNLARQLRIRRLDGPGGIHTTLLFIVEELERIIGRRWPIRDDRWCAETVRSAVKNLKGIEPLATLQAGPEEWRRPHIDCSIDHVNRHFIPALEKALTGELGRMLGDWDTWDIRRLRERRNQAIDDRRKAEADERIAAGAEPPRARRPTRDPKERFNGYGYTPPGRP